MPYDKGFTTFMEQLTTRVTPEMEEVWKTEDNEVSRVRIEEIRRVHLDYIQDILENR
jgi:hypothetical protein